MGSKDKKKDRIARAKAALAKQKAKGGGGGGGEDFYTIDPDSKAITRLFQEEDASDFYVEVLEHGNVGGSGGKGGRSVQCPRQWDEKCPVCDLHDENLAKLRKKNYKRGDPRGDKEYKNHVAPHRPRTRYYMNACRVIDGKLRSSKGNKLPGNKAQIFGAGPQIMEQVFGLVIEEEADVCGDFLAKDNRYDFIIKRTGGGGGLKQRQQTKYDVSATAKFRDVDDSKIELRDINEFLKTQRMDAKMINKLLDGEGDEEDSNESEEDSDIDDSNVGSSRKKGRRDEDESEGDDSSEDDESEGDDSSEEGSDDESEDASEDASDDDSDDDESEGDDSSEEDSDDDKKSSKKSGLEDRMKKRLKK